MNNCYFSHDSNARNSKKMLRLRKALGAEGYGTYFMLLERLREEEDYTCDADYEMLSYDLRVKPDIIKSVVEDFGLFVFNDNRTRFYSAGFNDRMTLKLTRREAGVKGAEARWGAKPEIAAEMAQNGKNIAKPMANEICHDLPIAPLSLNKKKEKEKENKDYYSSSQTLPPSDEEAGREEEVFEEEQQQEIIYLFFHRNYQRPVHEYHELLRYNRVAGRNWDAMSYKQRKAAAEMWHQRGGDLKRFPPESKFLLALWEQMYALARSLNADDRTLSAFLSDRLDICIRGDTLTLRCSMVLYDYIEVQHLDDFKKIFVPFFAEHGIAKLNYDTQNKT